MNGWIRRARSSLPYTATAYFVLAISLLAVLFAWSYVRAVTHSQSHQRFLELARTTQDAIVARMETYINALRDTAALFAASRAVEREEWRRFVHSANLYGRYPGLHGLGFARDVPASARATWLARVRADVRAAVNINPAGPFREYVLVDYIEPLAANLNLLARNLAADPVYREAYEAARATGAARATAPAAGAGATADIAIFLPVYIDKNEPAARASTPGAAVHGYVFALFHSRELLQGLFGREQGKLMRLQLRDREVLIYDSDDTPDADGTPPAGFSHSADVSIAGRIWSLHFRSSPAFDAGVPRHFPSFVLLSGLAISFLSFGVAWARARAQRREYVHRLALEQSEGRLKNVLQNSADLVWAFYFDGRPPVISRDCCGHSAAQLVAAGLAGFLERYEPESQLRLRDALAQVRTTREPVANLRLSARDRSGQRLTFLANITAIVDEHADTIGVQGNNRNITELETAQQALLESEARFWDIIETAHDLVWGLDRDGRWTYLNKATTHVYGYEPAAMLGRAFTEVMHAAHVERDLAAFQRALAGEEITHHETVHFHASGAVRNLSFNMKPRYDAAGVLIGCMGTARDVTEQKRYQMQLEHLAQHDALTGLHNRHYFQNELERLVNLSRRTHDTFGILYVDVDNFKYVNDTLSHAAGDQLLIELSQLQRLRLRQGDTLARFGGDEFTVLLHAVDAATLRQTADAFRELFEGYTFVNAEKAFDIRVSIGATLVRSDVASAAEALAQADLACAVAKSRGRNQVHIYDPSDLAKADMVADIGWTRKINEALEQDHFVLVYQPIVRIRDGLVGHYEVLLRLRDRTGELTAPGAFLPAAERFGLIHAIDRWVVQHAIVRLAQLHRDGARLCFSINLSGRAYSDRTLLPLIRHTLAEHGLDASALTFEITETAAIAHMADAREFIDQLHALGCRLALDDFGAGFSSYSYLKLLPVDYVKIDGSFVRELANDPIDQAIVQSMSQVAHALGKLTIAEYVEDAGTLELLRRYGIDYAQGFHLGTPSLGLPAVPLYAE